jgi:hypothetical protein
MGQFADRSGLPARQPRRRAGSRALYAGQIDTFAAATALFDHPAEAVSIPYQGTTLPGYLFLVDDSGVPRPTIIDTSGYDSTSQECYFVLAVAAMRRGYNVLPFDGPGQGGALHLQKLVMRPDWEAVITPVVDYALARREIEPGTIAGFGYSLSSAPDHRCRGPGHHLISVNSSRSMKHNATRRWSTGSVSNVTETGA